MNATKNLSQTRESRNIPVITTRPAGTDETGVILPAGTRGRIVTAQGQNFLIDFGLTALLRVPIDSSLIKFVRGER